MKDATRDRSRSSARLRVELESALIPAEAALEQAFQAPLPSSAGLPRLSSRRVRGDGSGVSLGVKTDTAALARIGARRADDVARAARIVLGAVLALIAIGLVMIDSTTMAQSSSSFLSSSLGRQLAWAGLALFVMWLASEVDHRWLEYWAAPLYIGTLLLLAAVLIPGLGSGKASYGARRWIRLGPVGLQPSELAKISMIVFLAAYLARRAAKLDRFVSGTLPVFAGVGAMCGLVLIEPDFGTALFLGGIAFLILFTAGIRIRHVVPVALLASPVVVHLVMTKMAHVRRRIDVFLDPTADLQGKGHQIYQSLIAMASGGLTGRGLGHGRQKLFFLPEGKNDFIFANLGEELGLIGCFVVIALFAAFVWYGAKIALCAPSDFGSYLALGIVLVIGLQAAINVAVVTASMPTKGISLPFVSYGGSSLVIMSGMVGVLLNVARCAQELEDVR